MEYPRNYENWVVYQNLITHSTNYYRIPISTASSKLPDSDSFPIPHDIVFSMELDHIIGICGHNFTNIYIYNTNSNTIKSQELPEKIDTKHKSLVNFSENQLLISVDGKIYVYNIDSMDLEKIDLNNIDNCKFTDDYILVFHGIIK